MYQSPERSLTCLKDAEPLLRTRKGRPVLVRRLTPTASLVRFAPDVIAICEQPQGMGASQLHHLQLHDWLRGPAGERAHDIPGDAFARALSGALVLLVPDGAVLRRGETLNAKREPGRWATISKLCPIDFDVRCGVIRCTTVGAEPESNEGWWLPTHGLRLAARDGALDTPSRSSRRVSAEWAVFAFLDWFEPTIRSYSERAAEDWLNFQEHDAAALTPDNGAYRKLLSCLRRHYESGWTYPALIPSRELCKYATWIAQEPGQTLESAAARIAKLIERWLKARVGLFIGQYPKIMEHSTALQGLVLGATRLPTALEPGEDPNIRY